MLVTVPTMGTSHLLSSSCHHCFCQQNLLLSIFTTPSLTAIHQYIELSTKTHPKLICSSTYMKNHFSLLYLFTSTQKHKLEISTLIAVVASSSIAVASTFSDGSYVARKITKNVTPLINQFTRKLTTNPSIDGSWFQIFHLES